MTRSLESGVLERGDTSLCNDKKSWAKLQEEFWKKLFFFSILCTDCRTGYSLYMALIKGFEREETFLFALRLSLPAWQRRWRLNAH